MTPSGHRSRIRPELVVGTRQPGVRHLGDAVHRPPRGLLLHRVRSLAPEGAPMSNISASDSRSAVLACISAQFTLYFDGRFWVGVLEHHERRRGGDMIGQGITVRAARHVFGGEPSDVELYDFLLARGDELIDRAAASPPVPASRWRARRLVAPTPSAPPGRPPRRPPGHACPPPRRQPWPLPVRRPRPVPPVTEADAVARRRTMPGSDVGNGPNVATAAGEMHQGHRLWCT